MPEDYEYLKNKGISGIIRPSRQTHIQSLEIKHEFTMLNVVLNYFFLLIKPVHQMEFNTIQLMPNN